MNRGDASSILNIAGTAIIAVPLTLAIVSYVTFIYAGLKKSPKNFFKNSLFPAGVPWPIYFIVTPIEFISTFLLRPITLAVRLFANLTAGHVMLSLLLVSGWVFISGAGGAGKIPIGVGWFVLGIAGGFVLAHLLNKDPRGHEVLADIDARVELIRHEGEVRAVARERVVVREGVAVAVGVLEDVAVAVAV